MINLIKTRVAIISSFIASISYAQTNTFPSSGSVGIGTLAPQTKTEINDSQPYTLYLSGYAPGLFFGPNAGVLPNSGSNAGTGFVGFSTFDGAYSQGKSDLNIGTQSFAAGNNSAINFLVPSNNLGGTQLAMRIDKTGKVGIGRTPAEALDVVGKIRASGGLSYHIDAGTPWWIAGTQNGPAILLRQNGASEGAANRRGSLGWSDNNGVKLEFVTWAENGNLSIGSTTPTSARLSIVGTYSSLTGPQLSIDGGSSGALVGLYAAGALKSRMRTDTVGNLALESLGSGGIDFNWNGGSGNTTFWNGSAAALMTIRQTGNVGIGTTAPTHKLSVNGTIKTKEVLVENTGWSDYVFAENYRLAPLTEVEQHIREKKHLPGIPSAAEVAENGFGVSDMQAKLLAKIEELTLHLIAQEKRIHRLESENTALRNSAP